MDFGGTTPGETHFFLIHRFFNGCQFEFDWSEKENYTILEIACAKFQVINQVIYFVIQSIKYSSSVNAQTFENTIE